MKLQPNKLIKSSLQATMITVTIYLIMICVISYFVLIGRIRETWIETITYLTLFLGSYLGNLFHCIIEKSRNIIAAFCSGIMTVVLLLIGNMIMFNGEFHSVIIKLVSIMAGAGITVINTRNTRKVRKKKRHLR